MKQLDREALAEALENHEASWEDDTLNDQHLNKYGCQIHHTLHDAAQLLHDILPEIEAKRVNVESLKKPVPKDEIGTSHQHYLASGYNAAIDDLIAQGYLTAPLEPIKGAKTDNKKLPDEIWCDIEVGDVAGSMAFHTLGDETHYTKYIRADLVENKSLSDKETDPLGHHILAIQSLGYDICFVITDAELELSEEQIESIENAEVPPEYDYDYEED